MTRLLNLIRRWYCLALLVFLGFPSFSRAADARDHWTINPLTNLHTSVGGLGPIVTGIAYGNDRYVAVGEYALSDFGFIETSDDGIQWTARADGPFPSLTLQMFHVTFGNGLFVACGWDGYAMRNLYNSADGIHWNSYTNANVTTFYGVAFGNGTFVAVGDGFFPGRTTNGNIYTSINGTNWIKRSDGSPTTDAHWLYDVVYGASHFVAVDNAGYAYSSATGSSWTRVFVGGTASISFANGLFYLPAGPGTNFVSTDGLTWTTATNDSGSTFRRVLYADELYIALSSTSLFTSTDATNWVSRGVAITNMVDLAYGLRNVVAVGSVPYTAETIVSDSFVGLTTVPSAAPQLTLSGLLNHTYEIDYKTHLTDPTWNSLTTILLTNSPLQWTDPTAPNPQRYYRAGLLP